MKIISAITNELELKAEEIKDLIWAYRQVDFTADDWREQSESVWDKWTEDWGYDNSDLLVYDQENCGNTPAEDWLSTLLTHLNEAIFKLSDEIVPVMDALRTAIENVARSMAIPAHYFEDVEPSSRSSHPRRRQ